MPLDSLANQIVGLPSLVLVVKAFLILFLIFYSVFALMLFRQLQLAGKTLLTSAVPTLEFVGLVNVGVGLALLFIVIGLF